MAKQQMVLRRILDALSTDAEPVAIYKGNGLVDCGDSGHHNIELLKLIPTNTSLYAAPPAPSVAVKELRWKGPDSYGEYQSLDGLWGYIIRCEDDGHWLTEVGNYFPSPEAAQAAAQADYEARIRSALSAQVQDVAGWQPIETAPKDGTTVLLYAPGWDSPKTGWTYGKDDWQDCPYSHKGSENYLPTHWMPLPAAPAKQEASHVTSQ